MFKNINIFRPILAILILFIPLYPKFPIASVNGTYVAIRLEDIVVAVSILIWVVFQIKNRFPVFKLKVSRLFLIYFLAIIASTINAIFIYHTDPLNILLLHMFRRFEYMSLFFIAIDGIKTKKDFNYPLIFLAITTFFVSLYGYGQKYLHFPIISTMNAEFSKGQLLQMDIWTRISSTFAGHYDLAAYLSVVLIIIGCSAFLVKNIFLKILCFLIFILSFPVLTLTASRVSIFAFWGGMSITLFFLKKYLWIIPVSLAVVFSMFNSTDLNQRLLATIPALKNQISQKPNSEPTLIPTTPPPIAKITPKPTIVSPKTTTKPIPTIIRNTPTAEPEKIDSDVGVARSGEIRFNAEWPRAINSFKKNIITGTGLGSITLATDNDYLRLLGESGSLGFISFMAINFYFILKTIPLIFKKNRSVYNSLSIIFLGGVLTTLANAVFIDVFEASKTAFCYWIMMGIYYQSFKFQNEKK